VEASPHCLHPAGALRPSRAGSGLLPAKRKAGLPDLRVDRAALQAIQLLALLSRLKSPESLD
jgi:hypothetical protein